MPEGDTIYRTARTLHGVLAGRVVDEFWSPMAGPSAGAAASGVVGSTVESVTARGKHVVMAFTNGWTLRSHMRMKGSWHVYREGSRWRLPRHQARVVLRAGPVIAVCFSAPDIELVRDDAVEATLARLGPDLLAEVVDVDEAVRRLRSLGDTEIGVAIMVQSAFAGVGNVYKSETLFACRVNPWTRVADLDDDVLTRIVETASMLMRRNLGGNERRTSSPLDQRPLVVYDRARQPCRRCGTPIRRQVQGEQARSTYWCPRCQAR
jgi:endonuclease-8